MPVCPRHPERSEGSVALDMRRFSAALGTTICKMRDLEMRNGETRQSAGDWRSPLAQTIAVPHTPSVTSTAPIKLNQSGWN